MWILPIALGHFPCVLAGRLGCLLFPSQTALMQHSPWQPSSQLLGRTCLSQLSKKVVQISLMPLKVVVKAASGTLFVFKPEQLHGTTLSHGAVNHNIAITFSQRVADGYREVHQKGEAVYSGHGAGEGNLDN